MCPYWSMPVYMVKQNISPMKHNRLSFFAKVVIAALAMVIAWSCAVNPVTGKRELMLMGEDQEKALGLQSDPGIIANFGLYQDETLQNFINEKGKEMGAISHRPHLDYQFRILDSPVVNAFAVPGGFVYFTRGIMAHFNNEAEFAGVLGHEIGHVTARHSASQYSKQMLAQGLLVAGVIASEDFRNYAGVAQQGLGLLFLKFGRDDESQSDQLGVEYSTKIGYNAHEMADFFQTLKRLSAKGGQSIPTFMSTHPDPADRYRKVHALADKWQSDPAVKKSQLAVNRNEYLQMIDGLVYGEDPRQGYFENNVFYHPEMKFQYPVPAGWRTNNTPQQVQMAPTDNKALLQLLLAQGQSLGEAANKFVTDNKLQTVNQRNTNVNGFQALALTSEQIDEQNQKAIRILSYFIQFNNLILQFNGMALREDFPRYERYFLNTMTKFRSLNDPSKINVKPERVAIKPVPATATLSQALTRMSIPSNRHSELAILNGMELSDQVQKGMLLKTITK